MNKNTPIIVRENRPQHVIYNLVLLLCAGLLFAAIFPSKLIPAGLGYLAPFCLVPLGILIGRVRLRWAPLWGFFYGLFAYGLFNIWLITFSPVAFLIVPLIYACYFVLVCFLLALAQRYFVRYAFLVQAIIWLVYEYARTNGFLGYSFGVLGYSLSFYPFLIQSADVFGVWGITFVLASISFFIAQYIREIAHLYNTNNNATITAGSTEQKAKNPLLANVVMRLQLLKEYTRLIIKNPPYKWYIIALAILACLGIVYGMLAKKDVSTLPTSRIALIQHNTDPWDGGYIAYKTSLDTLIRQTEKVMQSAHPPDLVVWSETSFVPSISYHLKYRENASYTRLIRTLLAYIGKYPQTEFLIGNGEGVKMPDEHGNKRREDYNASLFFKGNELQERYYKMHLVPFTEYFPYKKSMPNFHQFLLDNDTHFWLPGSEYTVFESKKFKFSTPICFEDGFGLQNAKFVRAGAEVLINITNDAWSRVESNAMQHLQLAIFRAVENRRSMARSTNAGMTAVIDPNGKVKSILNSFETAELVYDIPIVSEYFSLYTLWGDWFVFVMLGLLLIIISLKIVLHTTQRNKNTDAEVKN